MAIANADVVLISSDDEDDDGGINSVMATVNPEIVLISSDDEDDGERNLDDGVASEPEADYIELDDRESDKEEECIDNCERSGLFNQGGNNLHALSLHECKTYLRKHGIRVFGTKEECVKRIEDYERLKDGKAESCYPKSSFSINCTGDACRGDVVLFKQNMYNSQRNIIGRRTVAGRIIEESYSASTQHTFSVEVLWSKRCKKLNPLSMLQVKGRNLYQFGTYRQPWTSEAERSTVLEEKHERGKAARLKRKLRQTEFVFDDNIGKKRRKVFHRVSSHSKHNQAVLSQNPDLKTSTQLTCHSEPNCTINSDHHLQEASLPFSYDRTLQLDYLPPCSTSGHSHHSNANQVLSQAPDHHHHDSESPVHRSKDEKAKFFFPESSFSINCTGDAREKDIVLFRQHVFLGGKIAEKKGMIAGRIVKVRRRESKDKQKFLIKVLWTEPYVNNLRRSSLLVRSHNLYKFGTFRQPWENEAMRSKMFEEKHGPATRKRKLKKMDIALNKNKGGKCQKVSHKGPSSSKQPTQKAKHKSSKRKDSSANPAKGTKTCPKKKSVRLKRKKFKKSKQQTIQLHPNPSTTLDPSLSTNANLNLNSNPVLSMEPSLYLNPNQCTNPNVHQNQNSNSTDLNLNPISNPTLNPNTNSTDLNLNPNSNSTSNLNPSPPNPRQKTKSNPRQNPNPNRSHNLKPNKHKKPKPNTRQNQKSNRTDPNLNPNPNATSNLKLNPKGTDSNLNSKLNPTSNLNLSPHLNPNQHTNPNPRQNPNPNTRRNPHLNTRQNPHPNTCRNPNPNNYMPAHQLQEPTFFLANQPPVWFPPYDQPPVWFPPKQPPVGYYQPPYGGQWGPNQILADCTAILLLAALCYQPQ